MSVSFCKLFFKNFPIFGFDDSIGVNAYELNAVTL